MELKMMPGEAWIDQHIWEPVGEALFKGIVKGAWDFIAPRISWYIVEAIDPLFLIGMAILGILLMLGSKRAPKYMYWTGATWTLFKVVEAVI